MIRNLHSISVPDNWQNVCRFCSFTGATTKYVGNKDMTLTECKMECNKDNSCKGISYGIPGLDRDCCAGECWLTYGTSLKTKEHKGFDAYIIRQLEGNGLHLKILQTG